LPIINTNNERELLVRTSVGDEEAFTELFERYRNKIWTVAWKIVDSSDLAEEIVQDVFMKIWIKRQDLPQIKNFDAFLFIVARNHSFTCLKKIARGVVKQEQPENFFPASMETPENILLEKEFVSVLEEAIKKLPNQQREVWRLVKEEGMSRQEAADALGISVNTLKVHLKRALISVRAYCIVRLDPGLFLALVILYCL
jgi:RNA polymerase sigma-70 factor (family 1)